MINQLVILQTIQNILLNITQSHNHTFTNIKPFQFFAIYYQNNSNYMISIPALDPIYIGFKHIGGSLYEVNLNNTNLASFIQQIKSTCCYIMTHYGLVDSTRDAYNIMKTLQSGIHPDSIHEFKTLVNNFKNKASSESRLFLRYMVKDCLQILLLIHDEAKHIYFSFLDQPNNDDYVKNLPNGSLIQKQKIYNKHLRYFLLDYIDLYKIYSQKDDAIFIYDENGLQTQISDIHAKQINDFRGAVFDDAYRLFDKVFNGANENSYLLFLSCDDIFHKLESDFTQYEIISGQSFHTEESEEIFKGILNGTIDPKENSEIFIKNSAFYLMNITIEGRGLKSNSIFNLYGMQTYANSVSDDGKSCIYSKKYMKKVNSSIYSFIKNSMIRIEKEKLFDFDDFDENSFAKATYDYYDNTKENELNATDSFFTKLNVLKDEILKIFTETEKMPLDFKQKILKLLSFDIKTIVKLIRQYNKKKEAEKKLNEAEKLVNLVRFYLITNNIFKNEKVQGIKVNIYDGELTISEIIIDF